MLKMIDNFEFHRYMQIYWLQIAFTRFSYIIRGLNDTLMHTYI